MRIFVESRGAEADAFDYHWRCLDLALEASHSVHCYPPDLGQYGDRGRAAEFFAYWRGYSWLNVPQVPPLFLLWDKDGVLLGFPSLVTEALQDFAGRRFISVSLLIETPVAEQRSVLAVLRKFAEDPREFGQLVAAQLTQDGRSYDFGRTLLDAVSLPVRCDNEVPKRASRLVQIIAADALDKRAGLIFGPDPAGSLNQAQTGDGTIRSRLRLGPTRASPAGLEADRLGDNKPTDSSVRGPEPGSDRADREVQEAEDGDPSV